MESSVLKDVFLWQASGENLSMAQRWTRSVSLVVIESLSLQRSSAAQVNAITVTEVEGLCGEASMQD
jgi:hypothetical protein